MAKPTTKQELIDFCLRKLGAPVLEVNVDDEQLDDLADDAIQLFNERHFDGVERMYLKYKLTQEDIDRGKANNKDGSENTVGIVTTSATSTTISGYGTTTSNWYETSNFIQVPDSVRHIREHPTTRWIAVTPKEAEWYLGCVYWSEWYGGDPVRFQKFIKSSRGRMWR